MPSAQIHPSICHSEVRRFRARARRTPNKQVFRLSPTFIRSNGATHFHGYPITYHRQCDNDRAIGTAHSNQSNRLICSKCKEHRKRIAKQVSFRPREFLSNRILSRMRRLSPAAATRLRRCRTREILSHLFKAFSSKPSLQNLLFKTISSKPCLLSRKR